jgi:hypothetical protein
MSYSTGAISGTGTAYPSGAPDFTPNFWWGLCSSIFCLFKTFTSTIYKVIAKQYSLINAYYDFYEILLEFRLSPNNKIVLNL